MRLVQCKLPAACRTRLAPPVWLALMTSVERVACDDHGLNGERAVLAAEVYEQGRE